MFTTDLNAGVVTQMSPPPHDLERLRTTMVDFIVLSIKLVFMVLGVSYSRVLAQRPTGCCSASLSNKKQIVKCHNEISQMCDIHIGVPQGSVLGPILFILYVNDINQHVHIGAACNLYADDTLVYCSANNVDTLQERTTNAIACIKQWYDMNKLVINTAKSNVNSWLYLASNIVHFLVLAILMFI